MQIRQVSVPEVPGRLFVSDLPGRGTSFTDDRAVIQGHQIGTVVCLATLTELEANSSSYLAAMSSAALPWNQVSLQMNDGEVTDNLRAVLSVIEDSIRLLRAGENVLVHCLGGIGRTGTLAIGILIGIGLDVLEASVRVADAEAGPESGSQEALIEQIAQARI